VSSTNKNFLHNEEKKSKNFLLLVVAYMTRIIPLFPIVLFCLYILPFGVTVFILFFCLRIRKKKKVVNVLKNVIIFYNQPSTLAQRTINTTSANICVIKEKKNKG